MSWERKELLVWNKNLFSSFLKGYHWSNFFGRWESHFKHHATLIKILLITYYRMELAPDFLMRARLSYLLIIKIFRDVNGRHIAANAGWYRLRVSISAVCGGRVYWGDSSKYMCKLFSTWLCPLLCAITEFFAISVFHGALMGWGVILVWVCFLVWACGGVVCGFAWRWGWVAVGRAGWFWYVLLRGFCSLLSD